MNEMVGLCRLIKYIIRTYKCYSCCLYSVISSNLLPLHRPTVGIGLHLFLQVSNEYTTLSAVADLDIRLG